MRALLSLPAAAKRRIAGAPVEVDSQRLDLDTQVLLRLAARDPLPPLRLLTPEQARAQLRHSVYVVAGTPAELAEVRALTLAGAGTPLQLVSTCPLRRAAQRGR